MHAMVAFLLCAGAERELLSVGMTAGGCAKGQRGEGRGGSRARGDGTGFLRGERTKGSPPRRLSWLGADGFIFFLCMVRVVSLASGRTAGAGRPGASNTVN
jgi:hypothetical protein